jgi:hypothetical protein
LESEPLDRRRLSVSEHSVDRYRLFYPSADGRSILDAIETGTEVDWQAIWAFLGRRGEPPSTARYILHPERTGVFVVICEPDRRWDRIVTFLRFYGLAQHTQACRLWPGGSPVTARTNWLSALQEPAPKQEPVAVRVSDAPAALGPGARALMTPPTNRCHANLASPVGGATCRAIGATAIKIHADFYDEIGGFAALDEISASGAWRRELDRWMAEIPGKRGWYVEARAYTKQTRFYVRLVK